MEPTAEELLRRVAANLKLLRGQGAAPQFLEACNETGDHSLLVYLINIMRVWSGFQASVKWLGGVAANPVTAKVAGTAIGAGRHRDAFAHFAHIPGGESGQRWMYHPSASFIRS